MTSPAVRLIVFRTRARVALVPIRLCRGTNDLARRLAEPVAYEEWRGPKAWGAVTAVRALHHISRGLQWLAGHIAGMPS